MYAVGNSEGRVNILSEVPSLRDLNSEGGFQKEEISVIVWNNLFKTSFFFIPLLLLTYLPFRESIRKLFVIYREFNFNEEW